MHHPYRGKLHLKTGHHCGSNSVGFSLLYGLITALCAQLHILQTNRAFRHTRKRLIRRRGASWLYVHEKNAEKTGTSNGWKPLPLFVIPSELHDLFTCS